MTKFIEYEFPLNETMRYFLRLEKIYQTLKITSNSTEKSQIITFIRSLFELQEIVERWDFRAHLIKHLEKHNAKLRALEKSQEINLSALEKIEQDIEILIKKLLKAKRFSLVKDKFLKSIENKLLHSVSYCPFDIPFLEFWLNEDPKTIKEQEQKWLSKLDVLLNAIELNLRLLREFAVFTPYKIKSSSLQINIESFEILKIKYEKNLSIYPTISGSMHYVIIKFFTFSLLRQEKLVENVDFFLAKC